MIKLKCTCGQSLKVKPEYAGKRIKCPACQSPVQIPKPASENPVPPQSATQPSAKPKTRPKPASQQTSNDVHEAGDVDDFVDYEPDDYGDEYGMDEYQPAALPARRKKKKGGGKQAGKKQDKSDADSSDAISPKVLYSLYGLAGTVSAVVMFFIVKSIIAAGAADAASQALPNKFAVFNHEHVRLTAQYPDADGWEKESGGGTGGIPAWVNFKNDRQQVSISIRGSTSGTAMSDIATAGGTMMGLGDDLPDDLDPVAAVHNYQRDKISADYHSYEETEPKKIDTGFGDGRVSDFTAGSALSSEYGLRATVIASEYQYNIICKVPKQRLEEYRPVFERILQSVGR